MRWREFLGGVTIVWPLAARAQRLARVHHIAFVHPREPLSRKCSGGLATTS
jgi:hypothetical protein